MRYLTGIEEQEALTFLSYACDVAAKAACLRSKCGSIIVEDGFIIGEGFNSPAGHSERQRRCLCNKHSYDPKITDKTCCVHAEQRAIIDALKRYPDRLFDARLYFIRLDQDNEIVKAGQPYCTICSKMALDAGIAEFVLWHDNGIAVYDTAEYNLLSYAYVS